jgi:hypothetical protein
MFDSVGYFPYLSAAAFGILCLAFGWAGVKRIAYAKAK